ncbi:MAG: DUF58 domain-containing protein [Phycisphaeraceae bacterium]|nr:DUF58 domain-containing protein [Phycisphaeraceae bacterium]
MLTRELIERVRQIQIRTGRQVADVLAGEYVSVFRGTGVEFDEVRPYVPGDDVRTIDWNVTARVGAPFVKRYVEERQLTVMLLIDVSASQDFGSAGRSKREATAELCALLAFSAIQNDDKVGLTLFHGGIEQYIPPRKGQRHVLRVIREILGHGLDTDETGDRDGTARPRRWRPWQRASAKAEPRQATDIASAMEFLLRGTKRRTVCFVVSDFFDEGYERALRTANRKHDVIAVRVTDPRERTIPDVGLVTLTDAETGVTGVFDTGSTATRETFEQLTDRRHERLEQMFRSSGIDFITVDPSAPVADPLVQFFRQRERRMRR